MTSIFRKVQHFLFEILIFRKNAENVFKFFLLTIYQYLPKMSKIKVLFSPKFENNYLSEFSCDSDSDIEKRIELLVKNENFSFNPTLENSFSNHLSIEDFISTLFAICNHCENRTEYPYLDYDYIGEDKSTLIMFDCKNCHTQYFACANCLRKQVKQSHDKLNLLEEQIFEVELMQLVSHDNLRFYFLEGFINSLFPQEKHKLIYENEDFEIFLQNSQLFCKTKIDNAKQLLSKIDPEMINFQNFHFEYGDVEISAGEVNLWTLIKIKNSRIFCHEDKKFFSSTGNDGNGGCDWECEKHGIRQFCVK